MSDTVVGDTEADAASSEDRLHPLLRDADRSGLWGWIDRASDRGGRLLNPILIKEARQSLKSRQFSITFFLLLTTSWFWMITGVASLSPDIYHVPSGMSMLYGYYFLLAIPMMAMVPLAAYRSLVTEIDEGTLEMLAITKLSALRIVTGKLGSALLQMLIYFAALVPCFAFCYLLRGVDLVMIAVTIGLVFSVSLLLTSIGLVFATVTPNRTGQLLMLLALLAAIVFAEFLVAVFILDGLFRQRIVWTNDVIVFTTMFTLVGLSFVVLCIKAAAARIAPVTENRSTRLRWIMFFQQLIWVGSMSTVALWYDNSVSSMDEVINVGTTVLAAYWTLMGTLMLGESGELSPRVRRTLPQTTAGRMTLMWFNPGPGTGFMFAITTGVAGMMVMSLGAGLSVNNRSGAFPPAFAVLMCGYLCMYLGMTRLISMPLCRRFGNNFILPLAVMVGLLLLGCTVPMIVTAAMTGGRSLSYGPIDYPNWMYTLERALDASILHDYTVVMVAGSGLAVLAINMFLLFREFRYRKVAVPQRVINDEEESRSQ